MAASKLSVYIFAFSFTIIMNNYNWFILVHICTLVVLSCGKQYKTFTPFKIKNFQIHLCSQPLHRRVHALYASKAT